MGPAGPPAQAAEGLDWLTILDRVPFESFEAVETDRVITFPVDYGSHPNSPADVWNLAVHLKTPEGKDVGVHISMARVAIVPPDRSPAASEWEVREFWRGHATFIQSGLRTAVGEERVRRGFPGIAGYDGERLELRLDNWSLRFAEGAGEQLARATASFGSTAKVALDLVPAKAVISRGSGNAAAAPFIGYAVSRLHAGGVLTTPDGDEAVSGVAWFEHLWGDLPFPGGPTATDRLVLHLDDGTELAINRTRRRDGSGIASVDGFTVRADGAVEQVSEETRLTPAGTWREARGQAEYPIRWTLVQDDMELEITPVADDQLHGFLAPIWNGMVVAHGTSGSRAISAVGTLQLQGYEDE
jgi:predicted secreted hydrolase